MEARRFAAELRDRVCESKENKAGLNLISLSENMSMGGVSSALVSHGWCIPANTIAPPMLFRK